MLGTNGIWSCYFGDNPIWTIHYITSSFPCWPLILMHRRTARRLTCRGQGHDIACISPAGAYSHSRDSPPHSNLCHIYAVIQEGREYLPMFYASFNEKILFYCEITSLAFLIFGFMKMVPFPPSFSNCGIILGSISRQFLNDLSRKKTHFPFAHARLLSGRGNQSLNLSYFLYFIFKSAGISLK